MAERYPTATTPDRPEFEIRVDGEPIEDLIARDVIDIDVDERVQRHGICQLLVQNWDPDSRETRYLDEGPFTPGATIEVLLGYHSELETVFEGVITGLSSRFPAKQAPQIIVEARSRSILLAHPPRTRVIEESTDEDVIDLIAGEYDLTADTIVGATHESLMIDVGSDWDWILDRAERFGWVAYVRGETLVARPPAEPQSDDLQLEWGLNLTELRFDEAIDRVADPIVETAWDPDAQELVESEADASNALGGRGDRPSHGDVIGDLPNRSATISDATEDDSGTTTARAEGRARNDALRHLSGGGATVGLPQLRIDSWLEISGVGTRHGGTHYVSRTRHRVGPDGYTTEFTLGLPTLLAPVADRSVNSPALTIGKVADIEDPRGWGRVKVEFPWMADALDPVWARLAVLDAGPEFGSLFIPEVGHEVVVSHLGTGGAQPVVLGSLWNGASAPPEAVDGENNVRSIVTRSGHKLRFHDGDDALVEVTSAAGSTLLLDDQNSAVEIVDTNENSIKLSGQGVEITSSGDIVLTASSGKVKVDASGMESKTSGPMKLESTATLDVKASATLGLTGALVNIN